jgi:hypothetical protein
MAARITNGDDAFATPLRLSAPPKKEHGRANQQEDESANK